MALSFLLLALITLNGGIKYWLNVYSGVIGERTMRRLRHDLYQQVLRFPLPQFKTMSAGEIIPMIVAETEPIGGFIGESISLPAVPGRPAGDLPDLHLHAGLVAGPRRDRALSAAGVADPAPAEEDQPALEGAGADRPAAVRPDRRVGGRRRRDPQQRHLPSGARGHQRAAGQDLSRSGSTSSSASSSSSSSTISSRRSRRSSSTRSAATW